MKRTRRMGRGMIHVRAFVRLWAALGLTWALSLGWSPPAEASGEGAGGSGAAPGAADERKVRNEEHRKLHRDRVVLLMTWAAQAKTACMPETIAPIKIANADEKIRANKRYQAVMAALKQSSLNQKDQEKIKGNAKALVERITATCDSYDAALEKFGAAVCDKLKGSAVLDVRVYTDPVLANAAVLVDAGNVAKLIAWWDDKSSAIQRYPAEIRAADQQLEDLIDAIPESKKSRGRSGEETKSFSWAEGGQLAVRSLFDVAGTLGAVTGVGAGVDLGAAAASVVETGLSALARLIADRAKREGLGWFLETAATEVCGFDGDQAPSDLDGLRAALESKEVTDAAKSEDEKKAVASVKDLLKTADEPRRSTEAEMVRRELRTYWFPALCALAGERGKYMAQYGGGGKLLDGLRSALASDVRGWPGAAAGLGLAGAFWANVNLSYKKVGAEPAIWNLMNCRPEAARSNQPVACPAALALRRAGADFANAVMVGQNATGALYALSGAIDSANRQTPKDATGKLFLDGLQVAACAVSLPYVFDQLGESLPTSVDRDEKGSARGAKVVSPNLDRAQKAEALLIAGFATAPACWTIFGQGLSMKGCEALQGQGGTGGCGDDAEQTVIANPQISIERLTTVVRLGGRFTGGARAVEAQWGKLVQALKTYEDAAASLARPTEQPKAPDLAKLGEGKNPAEALKAAQELLAAEAQRLQKAPVIKVFQAALGVAQAGVDLSVVSLGAINGALDIDLYPGLRESTCDALEDIRVKTEKARRMLETIAKDLTTLRGVVSEDWGTTLTTALASLELHLDVACTAGCETMLPKLNRYLGLIITVVSEKDPDRLAEALDAVAMPPGGFRTKMRPGSRTVTISAFPGFVVAMEGRNGQYGVTRENMHQYYWSPELVMPLGVDFAFGGCEPQGWGYPGLFVSLIDPAAFLAFDPHSAARVPGPRLTTALAPGLMLRQPLGGSPLNVVLYGVYRPGLRSWEASLNGPAADAFQAGVGLTVDVTLFDLYTRRLP